MTAKKAAEMLRKFLFNRDVRETYLSKVGFYNGMSDEKYLKMKFRRKLGKELDLNDPKSFSEKLQWLKIHDHKPEYIAMVDKYEAKKYVAEIIGEEHIIPTLGVWDSFDEIDFDALPNQFVLKCTHDSGGLVICKDKAKLNKKAAREKIETCLRTNYFWQGREWPYKNVKPRIIAEQYMEGDSLEDGELTDYKLMCFNGKVRCSFLCTERYSGEGLKVTFFDENWNKMPFERKYPSSKKELSKPETYEEMVRLAELLSKDIPFVRVDFYEIKGKIYFGEMTFYPGSGMEVFYPEEWDYTLGSWIDLTHLMALE